MRHQWRNLMVIGVLLLTGSWMTSGPAVALAGSVHAAPTLGLLTGTFVHGSGFGQVRPKEVYNGGDPTGLVTSITWHSWGGSQAVGTGRSDWSSTGACSRTPASAPTIRRRPARIPTAHPVRAITS